MNKKEVKRLAYQLLIPIITDIRDADWPYTMMEKDSCGYAATKDVERLISAFDSIITEMNNRSNRSKSNRRR